MGSQDRISIPKRGKKGASELTTQQKEKRSPQVGGNSSLYRKPEGEGDTHLTEVSNRRKKRGASEIEVTRLGNYSVPPNPIRGE